MMKTKTLLLVLSSILAGCVRRPPPASVPIEDDPYRVIRQGDIVFVDIEEDPEACGLQYIVLHSGVTYAISIDGRILRRVASSSPEGLLPPGPSREDARPESTPGTTGGEQGSGAATPPAELLPAPAPLPDGGA